MDTDTVAPERSYPCSYSCGNQIDVILTQFTDSTTLMLCMPCFLLTAQQVLEAMIDPESGEVKAKVSQAGTVDRATLGPAKSRARKSGTWIDPNDPDFIEPFSGFDTEDDGPESIDSKDGSYPTL